MNDKNGIQIYDYTLVQRWACPDCYKPVAPPKRGRDGRCVACRKEVGR